MIDPMSEEVRAQKIKAQDADSYARLKEVHRLLIESDDHWLHEFGWVLEWLMLMFDEKEPDQAKADARERLIADLQSLADHLLPEEEMESDWEQEADHFVPDEAED
jgi:hypothetical protein